MNNNDEYAKNAAEGGIDESYFTPPETDETASEHPRKRTGRDPDKSRRTPPPADREDLSRWDTISDTQRKLIVFGALTAVVLLLVLILGVGGTCGKGDSCGSCGSCGLCSSCACGTGGCFGCSGSREIVSSYGDVLASDSDFSLSSPTDTSTTETSPSDAPSVTPSDAPADGDQPSADEIEVIEQTTGGLSSCSREADNEAGTGQSTQSTGFLGFLFGCSGCADGCSEQSCSGGLTDPKDASGSDVSGSDGGLGGSGQQTVTWPAQSDDAAYRELLRTQLELLSANMITLSSMDDAMAQLGQSDRVLASDAFRTLTGEMLGWCSAAESYDASLLAGDEAREWNALSVSLAGDLREYIRLYPQLICGETVSSSDAVTREERLNGLMSDTLALYNSLWSTGTTAAAQ